MFSTGQMLAKWQEKKGKLMQTLGTTLIEKMARSQQARVKIATVPTSIMATFLHGIVNFLIFYRLATGYFPFDVAISLLITIFLAFISPLFFLLAKEREKDFVAFTNHFMDKVMSTNGIDYLLSVRNNAVVSASVVAILFLLCFEVNSWYLIRVIVEYLISFWVADQVNQYRESFYRPKELNITTEFCESPTPCQLTPYDIVMLPVLRCRKVKMCEPVSFDTHLATIKPVELKRVVLKDVGKKRRERVANSMVTIIDDWAVL